MEKDLNKLRDRAYQIAKDHGFHEKEYSDEYWLMLIITEIAEAVNADRKDYHARIKDFYEYCTINNFRDHFETFIEDSVEDKLTNVAIRLFDFAGTTNTDLGIMKHSRDSDTFRGKKSFPENCFILVGMIVYRYMHQYNRNLDIFLRDIIRVVFGLAESYNIDLFKFIDIRMKYNELQLY